MFFNWMSEWQEIDWLDIGNTLYFRQHLRCSKILTKLLTNYFINYRRVDVFNLSTFLVITSLLPQLGY